MTKPFCYNSSRLFLAKDAEKQRALRKIVLINKTTLHLCALCEKKYSCEKKYPCDKK
jgi:hypothetical protein